MQKRWMALRLQAFYGAHLQRVQQQRELQAEGLPAHGAVHRREQLHGK